MLKTVTPLPDRARRGSVRSERAARGGQGVAVGAARRAAPERQVRAVGASVPGVHGLWEVQVIAVTSLNAMLNNSQHHFLVTVSVG